jgi:hypothetical protein
MFKSNLPAVFFFDIMKYETATILVAFLGLAIAAPVPEDISKGSFPPARILRGREVPQEHR